MRTYIRRYAPSILLSIGLILGVLTLQAQEDEPVNVGLDYFRATAQEDGVRLDWGTQTEINTAGFIIKRSVGTSDNSIDLPGIGFVNAQGDPSTPAVYSEVDTTAEIGQTYSYKLVEVEYDFSQNDLETVTITYVLPTPIIVDGGDPPPVQKTNTPVPTSTNTPASTPTNTEIPDENNSQPATAVPTHTATPQPTSTISAAANSPAPTLRPPASPTPSAVIDRAFEGGSDNVILAQEEPTAYPEPDSTQTEPVPVEDPYPDGQEPPALVPANPTSYPEGFLPAVQPTMAIIGSDVTRTADGVNLDLPAPSAEIIRGRILLWAGFLIAFFIFLSGVVGAIVLYRRRPS